VFAGNPKLEETDLFGNDYLLFNFNDYPSGMVTLFNLLVMGNWQIWMESYAHLTGSSWSLVYFVSFYLISVLLLLNLVRYRFFFGFHFNHGSFISYDCFSFGIKISLMNDNSKYAFT